MMLNIPPIRAVFMYLASPVVMIYYGFVEHTSWMWRVLSGLFGPGFVMTMVPGILGREVKRISVHIILFITGQLAYISVILLLLKKLF